MKWNRLVHGCGRCEPGRIVALPWLVEPCEGCPRPDIVHEERQRPVMNPHKPAPDALAELEAESRRAAEEQRQRNAPIAASPYNPPARDPK